MKLVYLIFISLFISACSTHPHIHKDSPLLSHKHVKPQKTAKPSALVAFLDRYALRSTEKAVAIAIDANGTWAGGMGYNFPHQIMADHRALENCEKWRAIHNVQSKCRIHKRGDKMIDGNH